MKRSAASESTLLVRHSSKQISHSQIGTDGQGERKRLGGGEGGRGREIRRGEGGEWQEGASSKGNGGVEGRERRNIVRRG